MNQLLTNTLTQHPMNFTGMEVLILKAILFLSVFSISIPVLKYTLIKKFTPVKEDEVKKEKPKFVYEMNYFEFKKAEKEFDKQQAKNEYYENFRRKYDGWLGEYYTTYAQKYCQRPFVYGYIGHELRTKNTDILLTTVVSNAKTKYSEEMKIELFGMWLCSRPSRHFMDKYEDGNDLRFTKEVKENLPMWLAEMEEFYCESTNANKKEVK